jgi:type II secretory pathway pseudopilin PulG
MDERADGKTVQFGALGSATPEPRDSPAAEAQTVQFQTVGAAPAAARDQAAQQPTPGRRSRVPLIVGAVVVAAALVAGITALLMRGDSGKPSEQEQVAAAIRHYYQLEREQGLAAASAVSCKEIRDAIAALPQDAGLNVKQDVAIEKIDDITIQGDTATAKLTAHANTVVGGTTQSSGSDTISLRLQREQGAWRFCTMPE